MKDYKKLYEDAIERAKYALTTDMDKSGHWAVKHIFPELAESEYEMIRKSIIAIINNYVDNSNTFKPKMLGWLEKQGEKKPLADSLKFANGEIGRLVEENYYLKERVKELEKQGGQKSYSWKPSKEQFEALDYAYNSCSDTERGNYYQGVLETIIDDLREFEKQDNTPKEVTCTQEVEVGNANKVEPKFKVGDWVVDNCGNVWEIKGILNQFYILEDVEGGESRPTIEWVDKTFHLWTITDAKDGDVLYFNDEIIVIFKNLCDTTTFYSYCYIEDNVFGISKDNMRDWWKCKGFKPATKEQRDLLLAKMHEAGYVWDENNKELRKIETQNLKFKIGDIVHCGDETQPITITGIRDDAYLTDSAYGSILFSEQDDWELKTKFNIGDWIVYNRIDSSREILYVYDIRDNRYYFNDICHFSWSVKECDEKCHLWTIADAKDGDVLAGSYGTFIFMGESDGYCGVLSDNTFIRNTGNNEWTEDLHPATKEQRDILFAKMEEAGYGWDSEKKELKIIDFSKHIKYEPNSPSIIKESTWNEEDERIYYSLLADIRARQDGSTNTLEVYYNEQVNWLKSIKNRLGGDK